MRRAFSLAGLLLAAQAGAQDLPYLPPPAAPAGQAYDRDAYAKAEKCVRAYAVRFATTAALAQDVADAALEACHHERSAAALARAGGRANMVTLTTLQADEPDLRRSAIGALLESRYPRAR